jgi:3-oxoadipate enol-lactonase
VPPLTVVAIELFSDNMIGAFRVDGAQTDHADMDGHRTWYRIAGDGEPVIQIHGIGLGHRNFDTASPRLATQFTVVDFDLPGCGLSDRPAGPYSVEWWADGVAGLIDHLGLEQVHVHSTSMGGLVGMTLAGKYPQRVRSLVVSCSVARFGTAGRMMVRNWRDVAEGCGLGSVALAELLTREAVSRAFLASAGPALVDDIRAAIVECNDLASFVAATHAVEEADVSGWLERITCPTLVIGGSEDVMTPWDQGPDGIGQSGIAERIGGSEVVVIPGAGHSTMFEAPEEHVSNVAAFFDAHCGPRPANAARGGADA